MTYHSDLKDLIARLRALNEKATPGRWHMAAKPSSVVGWPIVSQDGRSIASLTYVPMHSIEYANFNAQSEANGKLICALDPDTLGRLLDVAEAAVELRDAAEYLARASNAVGIEHFDTDTISAQVMDMQTATKLTLTSLTAFDKATGEG